MEINERTLRVMDAETKLSRARQQLRILQCSALCGRSSLLNVIEALDHYQRALSEADAAWAVWQRWHMARLAREADVEPPAPVLHLTPRLLPQPVTQPATEAPAQPTPRLRFARWLVQTGRLSDD